MNALANHSPVELCSALRSVRASHAQLADDTSKMLTDGTPAVDAVRQALVEFPARAADATEPMRQMAANEPELAPLANELSRSSIRRLALANGISKLADGRFLFEDVLEGRNQSVDGRTAYVQTKALSMLEVFRTGCPEEFLDLTPQINALSSTIARRLPELESEFFADPRSLDVIDEFTLSTVLDTAPAWAVQTLSSHPAWVVDLMATRPELRSVLIVDHAPLLQDMVKRSPAILSALGTDPASWDLRVASESSDPDIKKAAVGLVFALLAAGVQPPR